MVKKIFNVLIFITILSPFNLYAADTPKEPKTLEEALKVYSTPFIDDYRARYAATDHKSYLTVQYSGICTYPKEVTVKLPCTKADIDNITKLAKFGDNASLHFYNKFGLEETQEMRSKYAADKGEITSIRIYGDLMIEKDFVTSKNYINKAIKMGDRYAYFTLLRLYAHYNLETDYCLTLREGYNKYGLKFLGLYFVLYGKKLAGYEYEKIKECLGKTSEEILDELDTYEAKYYKGMLLIRKYKYTEALPLFEEVYNNTSDHDIKYNAGYCLGGMYYEGAGVKKNIPYGLKLLKEAVDEGYVVGYISQQLKELKMLPDKYRMINNMNFCDLFLPHKQVY